MDAESLKVKNPELLEYCGPTSVGGLITRIASETDLLRRLAEPDIVMVEDGYWVYWPTDNKGYLKAHHLRIIATLLDEKNSQSTIPQPEEPR